MSIKKLLDDLNKKYSDGSGVRIIDEFGDMGKSEVKKISTGLLSLDIALGGGIPEGRIIEIYGPESSGKTTVAIKFLLEVQKKYPEKAVAFIDVEHSLDPEYAEALGLDVKKIIYCQPDSAEQALNIIDELCASGEVKAIILDSVAQLVPKKEVEGDVGDAEMGMRARLLGQALRKIVPHALKNECTCFFINQVRMTMAMYGNPETTPGGGALKFTASVRIRTSTKKDDETSATTTFKIIKNKVGIPFKSTTIPLKYGEGFDYFQDLVTVAKETGIIVRGGAYFTFGENRWQGESAMREAIAASEELQKEIEEVVRNSIL